MLKTGLVSVTFRQLSPDDIIELVKRSGCEAIEWGGDVHVPHGDLDTARNMRKKTQQANLIISSYGSYYRVAESESQGLSFDDVLDTAVMLEAPVIRVWAGTQPSNKADKSYRQAVIDDSRRIAEVAKEKNIRVAYEYHANTLTDTNESAQSLIEQVDHSNMFTYWQPPNGRDPEYCLQGLTDLLSDVVILHVFSWRIKDGQPERRPLSEGETTWMSYLTAANQANRPLYTLLEFVRHDSPEQFLRDAETLRAWVQKCTTRV